MRSNKKLDMTRAFCLSFFAIALFLIPVHPVLSQSQDQPKPKTEAELLKERLQQLEVTVTELKTQLDALEQAKKNPQPAIVEAVYNPGAPATSSNSGAAPTKKRAEDESTFQVYGFAMLDMGYQFKQNHPDWFDVVRPTQLPTFAGQYAPNGKIYMGVRQSRLGFRSSTPTKYGELKTIFEFELFGTGADAGRTTFRLRHAYGELGKFGAGQYWTVFGDTDAYPNTFEYWGPNGLVWFRNVQFRWMPLKGKNSVTIGLEKPGASGDQGQASGRIELANIKPRFAFPDLTGHVRFDRDWGHIQISGVVRSIKWVDTNPNDQFDFSGSVVGVGGSFSSAFNFSTNNVGRFQFTYGKGIENYMNDAPVDVGVKTRAIAGQRPLDGVALPVFGMSAFLDHTWNKKFTSSFGYSMVNIQNSNAQAADAYHRGQYGIANLLYSPLDKVTIGGELQWGRRQNFFNGFTADDFRIQFGFKYNFSRDLKL
ncbi:MAG: DcaP family trimeric outer membrane transporter [Pyrinomonadaceae bacterium]